MYYVYTCLLSRISLIMHVVNHVSFRVTLSPSPCPSPSPSHLSLSFCLPLSCVSVSLCVGVESSSSSSVKRGRLTQRRLSSGSSGGGCTSTTRTKRRHLAVMAKDCCAYVFDLQYMTLAMVLTSLTYLLIILGLPSGYLFRILFFAFNLPS